MKTIKLLMLLLCILLLAACRAQDDLPEDQAVVVETQAPGPGDSTDYLPVFESGSCSFDLPQQLPEGQSVECGTLIVPEDRANPEGGRVQLAVAVFKAVDGSAQHPDPILFVEGGPGLSVLDKLWLLYDQFVQFNQERDLIFFDPRGTGLSTPSLDCPEYAQVVTDALSQNPEPSQAEQAGQEALAACGERLLTDGVNLSAYNLSESAADLNDLRAALGYQEWNIFAVSYGTRVAQELLRTTSHGIRSVVLDSVMPPQVDAFEEIPANLDRALRLLFFACQGDATCQAAYPDLETQLLSLIGALDEAPAYAPVVNVLSGERYDQVPVDGASLLNVVVGGLYSNQLIPYLPKLIADAANGDFSLLTSLRSNSFTGQMFMAEAAYYASLCRDELPFNSADEISLAADLFPQLAVFVENSAFVFELCAGWGIEPAGEEVNQAVVSDVPVLVLSGEFDPVSPPSWGQLAADGLGNAAFVEFANLGHSVVLSDACPLGITLKFFNDPAASLDSTCPDQIPLNFVVPTGLAELTLVPVAVPETGIQAVVPEGWMAVGSDYYISPDQSYELVFSFETETALADFLASWGAEEPGTPLQTGEIAWSVYVVPQAEIGKIVFLAVAPSETGFFLTLVVGPIDQAEGIRDYLFLPVLTAFSLEG